MVVKEFYNDVGEKNFYIHEICDENGNYIQLENGIVTVKEKVAPARPNPKSAASATYEGNIPKMTVSHSSTGVNENSERKSEREIPLEDRLKGDTLLDAQKIERPQPNISGHQRCQHLPTVKISLTRM